MTLNICSFSIAGTVVEEPLIRSTQSGTLMTTVLVRVRTVSPWKPLETAECIIPVVFFGKLASHLSDSPMSGKEVFVVGSISGRESKGFYNTSLIGSSVVFGVSEEPAIESPLLLGELPF